jgi:Carboxypeptidase regulatory-like domain
MGIARPEDCGVLRSAVGRLVLMLVCLIIGTYSAFGQAGGSATITGAVTDQSGAVVPDTAVTVTNTQNGLVTKATTASNGTYVVPQLAVGNYTVTFAKQGFKSLTRSGIVLTTAEVATVNGTLTVGNVVQTVEVSANAEMVKTGTAALGSLISEKAVEELPLNGRNPATLVLLSPGVINTLATGAGVNQGQVSDPNDTGASASGGRQGTTYYMLDGANSMDAENLLAAPFPNPDATQEFRVMTNNFEAQYGFAPGAVVSVVTKQGTNQWHGDAFEFMRNYALDAANWFTHTKPLLKQNQFGGSLGGPIIHNKLFIFGDYQGTRQNTTNVGTVDYVPNDKQLNGDWSDLYTGKIVNACGAGGPANLNFDSGQMFQPNAAAPFGSPVTCPAGSAMAGQTVLVKTPYVGNQVNPATYSTVAMNMEKSMPKTMAADGSVTLPGIPLIQNTKEYTIRGDYDATQKQRIFGRVFQQNFDRPSVTNFLGGYASWNVKYMNVTGGYSYTISPTLLDTARVSFNRVLSASYPGIRQADGSPVNLAILGSQVVYPPNPPYPPGLDGVQTNGWGIGQNTNAPMLRHNLEFADDLTWTKGKHLFVFGVDVLRMDYQDSTDWQSSPRMSWDGEVTGDRPIGVNAERLDQADFLLGYASFFEQGGGEFTQNYITNYAGFAQDSIRLKPNLTANIGVRWEPYIPATARLGRIAAWRPGQQSTLYPNSPLGLVFPGDKGINGWGGFPATWTNIDPRVGIAWQPHALSNTSVRAAFGVFAEPISNMSYHHIADVAPFAVVLDQFYTTNGLIPTDAPWSNFAGSSFVSPFPSPQPFATLASRPPSSTPFILPTTVSDVFASNFTNPKAFSWNTSIQHQFKSNMMLSVAYVGSETEHLFNPVEMNYEVNYVRLNPNFGSVLSNQSFTTASYNSLQASFNRRFSHGFQFTSNYTWSKCLDNGTLGDTAFTGALGNPYNLLGFNRGLCDTNFPQVFINDWVWQEPALHSLGKVGSAALGNWEVSGIWTFQSGRPFSIGGCGVSGSATPERANVTGQPFNVHQGSEAQWLQHYMNPAAFTCNAPLTFGTSARNLLQRPGTNIADVGVYKNFPFKERYRLQFRWEMFNAFNRPNFGGPNTSVTSTNFGKITGLASDMRVMQGALKLYF